MITIILVGLLRRRLFGPALNWAQPFPPAGVGAVAEKLARCHAPDDTFVDN